MGVSEIQIKAFGYKRNEDKRGYIMPEEKLATMDTAHAAKAVEQASTGDFEKAGFYELRGFE